MSDIWKIKSWTLFILTLKITTSKWKLRPLFTLKTWNWMKHYGCTRGTTKIVWFAKLQTITYGTCYLSSTKLNFYTIGEVSNFIIWVTSLHKNGECPSYKEHTWNWITCTINMDAQCVYQPIPLPINNIIQDVHHWYGLVWHRVW